MFEFFFHLRPKRIPKEALKLSNTYALGGITFFLFILTVFSGIFLLFYYTPTTAKAYYDVKKITFIIPFGNYLRDIHRLCGELMILTSFFHMVRVLFKKGIFLNEKRKINWKYGVFLFLLIFPLNFTGYVLIYDTVSFWGSSIVLNAIYKMPIIGHKIIEFLFGLTHIDDNVLLKFYIYHIVILPVVFFIILSIHFYYVRKAGGVTIENRDDKIDVRYLFIKEILTALLLFFIINLIVLFFYNAPIEDFAKSSKIPNIIRAPWYFWNFQLFLIFLPPIVPAFIFPLFYILFLIFISKLKNGKLIFLILHLFIIGGIIIFPVLEKS